MPGVNRQARWSRFISKVFDVKGSAPDLQVLDDVMPVASLYDPTDVEHHYGRDEYLWSTYLTVAAGGAGQYGRIDIKPQTGFITVIEGAMILNVTGGANYSWRCEPNAGSGLGLVSRGVLTDMRYELVGSPGSVFFSGTGGTVVAALQGRVTAPANTTMFIPIGIVADSDDLFSIGIETANVAMYMTLVGYDRRAEMSELG